MNLSAHAASAVLLSLHRINPAALREVFDELGAGDDIRMQLSTRLRRAAGHQIELGSHYTFVFSWLVANAGPRLGVSYELFEAEVAQQAKAGATMVMPVMPRWALSIPMIGALQRRMPCRPLVNDNDPELALAYSGLIEHLGFLASLPAGTQKLEIINTAIPCRVVALADRLEPQISYTDPIATRLQRLKGRTLGPNASQIERQWWRTLDGSLCSRRHALSHLGDADGWTFSKCVNDIWTVDEARAATAGIGLAVLDRVARYLRDAEPPVQLLDTVLDDPATSWLDDQND